MGRYDGDIRYLDTELGRLFSYLKSKDLFDNSIIVVVSDHGEQFLEHGNLRHGISLHNEEVHVPLFIHTGRSSDRGRVVPELTSTVDIMPTLLELLKIPAPPSLPGISLLNPSALQGRSGVISEVERKFWVKQYSRSDGKKILFSISKENPAVLDSKINFSVEGVFDVTKDYFELLPLADPGLTKALEAGFRGVYQSALQTRAQVVKHEDETSSASDKTLKELKSLGYFQ